MATKKTVVRSTTVVVTEAPEQFIHLDVDDRRVSIPVSADVKAYFNEQFKTNTENQQKRHRTVMNLLRAAYKKGFRDGAE